LSESGVMCDDDVMMNDDVMNDDVMMMGVCQRVG
jgi:hypothetical protein